MSHKHEHLLRTIFHDPISANIHWREIESLLNHLNASVEQLSGARLRVTLNGVEGILHRPHHGNTLDKSAVRHLREYLAHARLFLLFGDLAVAEIGGLHAFPFCGSRLAPASAMRLR